MRGILRPVPAVAVLLLAGCARPAVKPAPPPPTSKVSYRAVADKHARHYSLASTQTAVNPTQMPDNPAPAYPPSLVARRLPPVVVQALLVVDAAGRVTRVEIAGEAQDDAVRRAFDAAVRTAALEWRFTPLRIASWAEDAQGNEHRVAADPKPFSQTYRFHLEVRDGKPVVQAGAP